MDVLYQVGEASVADVQERIPDPPSYSAVRAMLRLLEEKGHITHKQDGPRYIYSPTPPQDEAGRSALRRVLTTFFDDSPEQAMAALLDLSASELSDNVLDELEAKILEARKKGR